MLLFPLAAFQGRLPEEAAAMDALLQLAENLEACPWRNAFCREGIGLTPEKHCWCTCT